LAKKWSCCPKKLLSIYTLATVKIRSFSQKSTNLSKQILFQIEILVPDHHFGQIFRHFLKYFCHFYLDFGAAAPCVGGLPNGTRVLRVNFPDEPFIQGLFFIKYFFNIF